ncbi:hypothetical protein BU24DRAFT_460714 [Aaosphaeria arxii CBS 175.79]|uniref:DRBM domain-containing protein n=1 Tax=Aaosphaeria arxii CBS 175.79 TaxID=1450172 RepID=A0A6A5XX14_9PLEO|nr:uncharacterized protein BU24DRAFT_460714 [Aaosphaeria arxii CBS 175.79]KAF2017702.1 hypothetical protein BU24DRAFT_460714 [Aaosphaeria arxii CBS 175.79]
MVDVLSPSSAAQAPANIGPRASPNIFTVDEFLNGHDSIDPSPAPASSRSPLSPKGSKAGSPDSASPVPTPIGARSSRNTIQLHEKCQSLALPLPRFETIPSDGQTWKMRVVDFLDTVFEEETSYGSKAEAKEAVSGLVLAFITDLEARGKLTKPTKQKKTPGKGDAGSQSPPQKEVPGPNNIGLLLEYQHAQGAPQATYHDFSLGTRFSCVVAIDLITNPTSTTTTTQTFGSQTQLFPSKKSARQSAAGLAIQHIKTLGLWPSSLADDAAGGIRKKPRKSNPNPTSPPSPSDQPSTSSPASQVHLATQLALSLGLGAPEYRFDTSTPSAVEAALSGFHTVACFFNNGGEHAGPIGEVRHVFGRRKAKEECARGVVEYLSRVRDERTGDAGRAVKEVEAQREGERDDERDVMAQLRREMGFSDSEEEFEDAVEGV